MIPVIRPVVPVLIGVAFIELALGALSPLVGVQLAARRVSPELIGLVTSAYFVGFLAGTLTGYKVIDRVGHIRAFSVFAVIASNAALLHLIFDSAYAWLLLRVFIGYGIAGQFVIVESWLNDKATSDNRGQVFAIYMVVAWGTSGVGPLALNLPDPDGSLLFALIALTMSAALVPMALTRVGNPEIAQRSHFGILQLYRISPLGVLACFASGLINTALYGLLAVYTEDVGYSERELSILLSVSVLGGLLVQYPVGYMSDRFGRRPLMLAIAFGGGIVAAAVAVWGDRSFAGLLAMTFVLASIVAPLYALGVGQTNDYIERKDFVAASSGLLFAWGVGAVAGPALAGLVMRPLGGPGLFVFLLGALVAVAGFVLFRIAVRPALSAEEQGNYVAVPVTQCSYGAPELDPRAAEAAEATRAPAE
ncbi:MAG: MFS transporter [Alphaproteobacteria bacterium]|nr:MAG: MFS transporter [Alphaproteobacteria bacterium]